MLFPLMNVIAMMSRSSVYFGLEIAVFIAGLTFLGGIHPPGLSEGAFIGCGLVWLLTSVILNRQYHFWKAVEQADFRELQGTYDGI